MVTMTITQLRLKIEDLKTQLSRKTDLLYKNRLKVSIKEITGHEEKLTVPFDFEEKLAEVEVLTIELANLNSQLALINNTTKINDVHTIQSAIAELTTKRKLLKRIDDILEYSTESTQRKVDSNNSPAYYNITEFNFDKPTLEVRLKELTDEINELESLVSKANETDIDLV